MPILVKKSYRALFLKGVSAFVAVMFLFMTIIPPSFAQMINLPTPGAMVHLSSAYVPTLLKGMTLHADDPFRFDFIVDSGNNDIDGEALKKESKRLVNYFLASMTVPKNDLWVNLSPTEKDRIVPDALGKTALGQDLLAQDYILKQLTASLMYPEGELGKKFWDKIYKEIRQKYGVVDIPTDTLNKVWIMPQSATVYEHGATVYVVDAKLKVMLAEEYEELARNAEALGSSQDKMGSVQLSGASGQQEKTENLIVDHRSMTTAIIKQIILPAIEKEVNEGENFAPLRQIYHSLILAKWYKEKVKNSILNTKYADQNKVVGIDKNDPKAKEEIYARYIEAYKKGVYNYIKEEYDVETKQIVPTKYFSGGFMQGDFAMRTASEDEAIKAVKDNGHQSVLQIAISPEANQGSDKAMLSFIQDWKKRREARKLITEKLIIVLGEYFFKDLITKEHIAKVVDILDKGYDFDVLYKIEPRAVINEGTTSLDSAGDYGVQKFWDYNDGTTEYEVGDPGFQNFRTDQRNRWIEIVERIKSKDSDQAMTAKENVDDWLEKTGVRGKVNYVLSGAVVADSLGVYNGEVIDVSFINSILPWAQDNPVIAGSLVGAGAIATAISGYRFWRYHTISGNLSILKNSNNFSEEKITKAIEFLGEKGDPRAIDTLLSYLGNYHYKKARVALEKLNTPKDKLVDAYIEALKSGLTTPGKHAIEQLGELGDKKAIDALLPFLKTSYYKEAQIALEKLNTPKEKFVDAYIEVLKTSYSTGAIKQAIEQLEKLLPEKAKIYREVYEKLAAELELPEYKIGEFFKQALEIRKKEFDFIIKYHPGTPSVYIADVSANYYGSGVETWNTLYYSDGTTREGVGISGNIGDIVKEGISEYWKIVRGEKLSDNALITEKPQDVGGIDLNDIQLKNDNDLGGTFEFNKDVMKSFENIQIDGFSPIIIDIKPVTSILPLLGLNKEKQEKEIAKAS